MILTSFAAAALSLALVASPVYAQADNSQSLAERDLIARYSQAHTYPTEYDFQKRDGWIDVDHLTGTFGSNASNVSRRAEPEYEAAPKVEKRSLLYRAKQYFKKMRGVGNNKKVIITWYTGHDLLNPSCWSNTRWAPTDNSFICALTASGWNDRPKCYKFVELCLKHKCVFVRVVDSCAGCQVGSAHVDLTKAAFKALTPLSVGKTHVRMRHAQEPEGWSNALWGPIEDTNRQAQRAQKGSKGKKSSHKKKSKH